MFDGKRAVRGMYWVAFAILLIFTALVAFGLWGPWALVAVLVIFAVSGWCAVVGSP